MVWEKVVLDEAERGYQEEIIQIGAYENVLVYIADDPVEEYSSPYSWYQDIVIAGAMFAGPMLFGDFFGQALVVLPGHETLAVLGEHFHGAAAFALHGIITLPFWLAVAGVATAWFLYMYRPDLPDLVRARSGVIYNVLIRKYGFDDFNDWFFAGGARGMGQALWRMGDEILIDGLMVNGSARLIGWVSSIVRHVQSGYLFHYAFAMIIGLLVLMGLFVTR